MVSMDHRTGTINAQKFYEGIWTEPPLSQPGKVYPNNTNKIVIVASGDMHKVYLNSFQNPSTFTDNTLSSGTIILAAVSSDGENANGNSSCTFKDVWVWAPNN
jgi:hypothetical protein